MRKTFKKVIVSVLSTALALTSIVYYNPVAVKAADTKAFLMFTDNDWAFGNWDANLASTTVNGDGSYSVTLNAKDVGGDGTKGANGANVFCIDIVGAQAAMQQGKTYKVTSLSITADGKSIPVDMNKIECGDLEANGNYRIEIYNSCTEFTKNDPPIDASNFTFKDSLKVDFTIKTVDSAADTAAVSATTATTAAPVETTASGALDLNGKYNAYLGIQTPNWTYRDSWNAKNGKGSEFWGQYVYGNETKKTYGTVTDAVVEGNGTYTVSIKDFGTIFNDDFTTAKQDHFNLLFISTDIPRSDSIKVTNVIIKMDGKTIKTYDEAYLDPDDKEYVKILIQNIWNEDVKEIPFYAAPKESVEMSFTVSGFSYDNKASKATEATTETTVTQVKENNKDQKTEDGNHVVLIIIVVAAVLAVGGGVTAVVLKKKKAK